MITNNGLINVIVVSVRIEIKSVCLFSPDLKPGSPRYKTTDRLGGQKQISGQTLTGKKLKEKSLDHSHITTRPSGQGEGPMGDSETQVEHIRLGNPITWGRADRKPRMTPHFKIKQDVRRTRVKTRTE